METNTYQDGSVVVVRRAQLRDAKPLAVLAETTFRETFGSQNADDDMELYCRKAYGEEVQAREIAEPTITTFVGEAAGGRLAGFAQLRWGSPPACVSVENSAELQRLYVAKKWQGRGVAPLLMQACLDLVAARGFEAVWLGVWERNPRAISFYKKFGFVEVGDHVFTLGRDRQRDILMMRKEAEAS